jgi:hypothetical protein
LFDANVLRIGQKSLGSWMGQSPENHPPRRGAHWPHLTCGGALLAVLFGGGVGTAGCCASSTAASEARFLVSMMGELDDAKGWWMVHWMVCIV